MKARHLALVFAAGSILAMTGPWSSQPVLASEPAATAATSDAAGLLAAVRTALKEAPGLTYKGVVLGGGDVPQVTADVALSKGTGSLWNVAARGKGRDKGESREFAVAFDGTNGRSLRTEDKAVLERPIKAQEELSLFFTAQGAGPVVAWELVGPEAFAGHQPTLGEPKSIDGVRCQTLTLTQPGSNVALTVFVGPDNLPRRIDRTTTLEGGRPVRQSLLLRDIAAAPADSAAFTVQPPEGFTLRPLGGTPSAAAPTTTPTATKPPALTPPVMDPDYPTMAIGERAPDFELVDGEGVTRTWKDYEGKVVLIDFWGTWCPPCRAAMPMVQRIHERYQGQPVAVLGFNSERRKTADPIKFKKDNGYTYAILLNAEKVAKAFKVPAWPTFYIIGADRTVKWANVGFEPEFEQQMIQFIDHELATMKKGG